MPSFKSADHDDRVVPLHSYKLLAQLQYKLAEKFPQTPIMARIDTKSGHGFGKPTDKIVSVLFLLSITILLLALIDIFFYYLYLFHYSLWPLHIFTYRLKKLPISTALLSMR